LIDVCWYFARGIIETTFLLEDSDTEDDKAVTQGHNNDLFHLG
jgi:hypothetical protein